MGARLLAPLVDVLVVVDTLSFSTSVDVAVSRGAVVYPVPLDDDGAAAQAERAGAVLAAGRTSVSTARPYSLSPASLTSIPQGTRLVLPSPNGAAICAEAGRLGATVIAGCLRNAAAVAAAVERVDGAVGVVAAGERWPDGSLRPAVEDLVGAGAILAALGGDGSPEARAAIAAAAGVGTDDLRTCVSAAELVERGFAEDVELALQRDVSSCVPLLRDGAFHDRGLTPL